MPMPTFVASVTHIRANQHAHPAQSRGTLNKPLLFTSSLSPSKGLTPFFSANTAGKASGHTHRYTERSDAT